LKEESKTLADSFGGRPQRVGGKGGSLGSGGGVGRRGKNVHSLKTRGYERPKRVRSFKKKKKKEHAKWKKKKKGGNPQIIDQKKKVN